MIFLDEGGQRLAHTSNHTDSRQRRITHPFIGTYPPIPFLPAARPRESGHSHECTARHTAFRGAGGPFHEKSVTVAAVRRTEPMAGVQECRCCRPVYPPDAAVPCKYVGKIIHGTKIEPVLKLINLVFCRDRDSFFMTCHACREVGDENQTPWYGDLLVTREEQDHVPVVDDGPPSTCISGQIARQVSVSKPITCNNSDFAHQIHCLCSRELITGRYKMVSLSNSLPLKNLLEYIRGEQAAGS